MQPYDPAPAVTKAWDDLGLKWLALTFNDPPKFEQWIEEFREHFRFNVGLEDMGQSSSFACGIAKLMMHAHMPRVYSLDQEHGVIEYTCQENMIPHWQELLDKAMSLNLALINELTRP